MSTVKILRYPAAFLMLAISAVAAIVAPGTYTVIRGSDGTHIGTLTSINGGNSCGFKNDPKTNPTGNDAALTWVEKPPPAHYAMIPPFETPHSVYTASDGAGGYTWEHYDENGNIVDSGTLKPS